MLATTGYGGRGVPEQLLVTLEARFARTSTPRSLTLIHSGQGYAQGEGFSGDDEAMHAYMDAVKYVEERYCLTVSRFTNTGYLRLRLAKELA